jgi:hypothetical protein
MTYGYPWSWGTSVLAGHLTNEKTGHLANTEIRQMANVSGRL